MCHLTLSYTRSLKACWHCQAPSALKPWLMGWQPTWLGTHLTHNFLIVSYPTSLWRCRQIWTVCSSVTCRLSYRNMVQINSKGKSSLNKAKMVSTQCARANSVGVMCLLTAGSPLVWPQTLKYWWDKPISQEHTTRTIWQFSLYTP